MFKTLIVVAFVAGGSFWGAASAKEIAFEHGAPAETTLSKSAAPDKFIVAELFDEDGIKGESDDSKHEKSYW
jgi:hypothetical protein